MPWAVMFKEYLYFLKEIGISIYGGGDIFSFLFFLNWGTTDL